MKNVFFIHFNTETVADFKNDLPEALVISLDRLPSHGRQYAQWFLEAKKRQHIPIVFCGGLPEKKFGNTGKISKSYFLQQ